jgi:hypothetical protein
MMRPSRVRLRICLAAGILAAAVCGVEPINGQGTLPAAAPSSLDRLNEDELRTWLTNLSSDLMQGRAVFTEGYGLASSYIAGELRAMGVKPMGDHGSYFQAITRGTYRSDRQSSMTVVVNGERRTFVHGEGVTFPLEGGGRQTLRFKGIEFAGAGQTENGEMSRLGRDVSGKLVLYMPAASQSGRGRGRTSAVATRSNFLVQTEKAAAVIALAPGPAGGRTTAAGAGRAAGPADGAGGGAAAAGTGAGRAGSLPTFTSVLPIGPVRPPVLTADDELFAFLLGRARTPFKELQARADRGDSLPMFTVPDVEVTIEVNNTYQAVTTAFTQNVVAMVEGSDPNLRNTYVFFGAHLDHVGYSSGTETQGRVNTPLDQDRIWNGADDDGSGSVALLALAKAFQSGPRPKRSVVFVWHAAEEEGMLGSEFMAAHPVVPLESIQAQLNIDMIGRNRDDDPKQANTVYLIGADRISTELHNLLVDTNVARRDPLTLDYEFNDVADPNRFYVRSDHYSYASRGIPIVFFFTGTHPDYHANTDTVDKIIFPKLRRIAHFVYETGFRIANSSAPLERDFKGPRSGKGFSGKIP